MHPRGFVGDAVVPSFALRQRLSRRWAIGLDIIAPGGLRSDYKPGWAGRYQGMKISLLTIDIMPTVSFQLTRDLAIGAGAEIEYGHGLLTSTIDTGTLGALNHIPGAVPGADDSFARVSGFSWEFGYTVGLLDHVTDALSV